MAPDGQHKSVTPRVMVMMVFAACLPACDAEVTVLVEPDEDGGPGGAGAPKPEPAPTRDELDAACAAFCGDGDPECDVWWGFCETSCESLYYEGCQAEAKVLLECLATLPPEVCRLWDSPCEVEQAALIDCVPEALCQSAAVVMEPGKCSISGVCDGAVVSQECYALAEDVYRCDCYQASGAVLTCEDVGVLSCSFMTCCGSAVL